jgi:hypothetical protein
VAAASAGAEGRRKAEEWVIVGRAMGAGRRGGPAGVRAGDGAGRWWSAAGDDSGSPKRREREMGVVGERPRCDLISFCFMKAKDKKKKGEGEMSSPTNPIAGRGVQADLLTWRRGFGYAGY